MDARRRQGATRGTDRRAWIATGIGAMILVLHAAAIAGYLRAGSLTQPIGYGADLPALLASNVFGTACAVMGVVVVRAAPGNVVGWLLVALGLAEASVMLALYSTAVAPADPAALPLGLGRGKLPVPQPTASVLGWLASASLQPVVGAFVGALKLTFPDGRLPSRRWRPVVVALAVGATLRFIEVGFGSPNVRYLPKSTVPFEVPDWLRTVAGASEVLHLGLVILVLAMIASAASLVVRYRGAGPEGRRQVRWFVAAGVITTATVVLLLKLFVTVDPSLGVGQDIWVGFFLAATLQPVAIAIAIARARLYAIDRLINRAFVFGTLTAFLAGAFTASITLSQRLFIAVTGESSDVALVLTTLVVASAYTPARRRLEALAERHLKYEDPHFGAYRESVRSMITLLDPREAARRLLMEAVDELGSVGGRVQLGCGPAAEVLDVGVLESEADAIEVDLRDRGGPIGRVLIGPRADGRPYRPGEVRAVTDLAELVERVLELPARVPTEGHAVRGDGEPVARLSPLHLGVF